MFHSLRPNEGSTIDIKILLNALGQSGYNLTKKEVEDIFVKTVGQHHDKDSINYKEFLLIYHKIPTPEIQQFLENFSREQRIKFPFIGEPSLMITLISAAVSGGISRTLTAPLDRVKILMQANKDFYTMR